MHVLYLCREECCVINTRLFTCFHARVYTCVCILSCTHLPHALRCDTVIDDRWYQKKALSVVAVGTDGERTIGAQMKVRNVWFRGGLEVTNLH